jgi:hypothetical protein
MEIYIHERIFQSQMFSCRMFAFILLIVTPKYLLPLYSRLDRINIYLAILKTQILYVMFSKNGTNLK